jgi:hypothetical protein
MIMTNSLYRHMSRQDIKTCSKLHNVIEEKKMLNENVRSSSVCRWSLWTCGSLV